MPELPEVEVVRRQLERPLLGRQIAEAWAHPSPKFVSGPDAIGSEVEALRRRGKYLIAELDCGRDLVVHLGMTGRLCFAWRADAAGAPHDSSPQTLAVRPLDGPAADVMGDAIGDVTAAGKLAERYSIGRSDPHVRAWWRLDNGEVLCLHDVRRFGRIAVCDRGDYRDLPTLAAMGPEPLDPSFDAGTFWRASRRSSLRIKDATAEPAAGRRHRQHLRRRSAVSGPHQPLSAHDFEAASRTAAGGTAGRARRQHRPGRQHVARLLQPRRRWRQSEVLRLLRPSRRTVRALRYRNAPPGAGSALQHLVPQLPAPLTRHVGLRLRWHTGGTPIV